MSNRLKDLISGFDDQFEETQKALELHRQAIAATYEPSDETIAFNKLLEPLGFDHQGDFYPVEFPVDEFEFTEIEKCAIATSGNYMAVLNYSIMEYWEIHQNTFEIFEMTKEILVANKNND